MSETRVTPEALFTCRQCGDCCRGFGGTYVSDSDIEVIARYVKAAPERFLARYCQPSGSRWVVGQGANGYCVFWRDGLCAIHLVKPRMCREWPFIRSVARHPENWFSMAVSCPGMRTEFSPRQIAQCVQRILAASGDQGGG
ncbi:MAG: YkgJ family cysteine cluster protein [Desulfobacterales bacterium]|nr:YkgJ family cysteine cluster protein [Desulfobacterales bacterium]